MFRVKAILLALFFGSSLTTGEVFGNEGFSTEDLAFFESKVRPLLAERCYECHSHRAKKLKGGLYLDSRAGALRGGDTGPAVTPGDFEKSLLVEAVRYHNPDMRMPPKSKLSVREIETLELWVSKGAPWPKEVEPATAGAPKAGFNLEGRKASHWAWKPVNAPALPEVKDKGWGAAPIDRFILARLEKAGLAPAEPADRNAILRRATFALRGMPPTPEEVEAFVSDESPDAWEKVVDRLLAEPAFGETWARHWMDLFRYAESRGHEFDYNVPNAYRYRDYLIRALNADLPYDQFVTEHVAGDLLENPRLRPETGADESVLATGFWFLGEWVHSPVDTRQDEADRYDNMLGVFSKSFLGLTVACARCHDHKFDAISTKDFYSLQSYLQSSGYRQVRYETNVHNGRVARELVALEQEANLPVRVAEKLRPGLADATRYLLAAGKVLRGETEVEKDILEEKKRQPAPGDPIVFADFEDGTYGKWLVTGTAFGKEPLSLRTKAPYQKDVRPQGKYFVNSHNTRTLGGDGHVGSLTSPTFRIERDYVSFLVGGGPHKGRTCVNLLLNGKVVLSQTGRSSNTMFPVVWDVRRWKGAEARIQVIDNEKAGWGNIGLDHVVFTNRRPDASPAEAPVPKVDVDERAVTHVARTEKLDESRLLGWIQALVRARADRQDFLAPVADALANKTFDPASVATAVRDAEVRRQRYREAFARLEIAVDYGDLPPGGFVQDGYAFGSRARRSGELLLDAQGASAGAARWPMARREPAWRGLRVVDSERDAGRGLSFVRAGTTLRTPTFTNKNGDAHYLLYGKGKAFAVVDSHRLVNGPLHGNVSIDAGAPGRLAWASQDLDKRGQTYLGHRLHVEFTPTEGDEFQVLLVDLSTDGGARNEVLAYLQNPPNALLGEVAEIERLRTRETFAAAVAAGLKKAAVRLASGGSEKGFSTEALEGAVAVDWLVRNRSLFADAASEEAFQARYQDTAARIKKDSRTAMAMLDGTPETEYVFIRGNHRSKGEEAPRRFLEALGGLSRAAPETGSGRLELARQITDPEQNPYVTRVLVNRLWHHLFGRGIVASTDDFGVLGQRPTHPELLDHLARRLVANGWSVKKTLKEIMLSRAYRMSSAASGPGEQKDPANHLLHRANLRRLPAEAIRDSLLFLSGRLDSKTFGPSVPTYLTGFMQGRGRPRGGPLDGAGRRSVYLSVRRNFLSPFMLAFDTPSPVNAVGRRTTSNVPSQSLILMNDPFVLGQADLWAKRLRGQTSDSETRVRSLYKAAFARSPSPVEVEASLGFLASQAKLHNVPEDHDLPWRDLVHAVINAKEFIFLN